MRDALRPYQPSDLESCRALWRELTQRHRDIYDDPMIGGSDSGGEFDLHLARPQLAGIWVAEVDAIVVGFCGLLVDGDGGEIDPMVVSSAYRSQGIGRQLLDHMVGEAKRRGVRFLSVRPVARNIEAISFYFEAGFQLLGHVDMFVDLSEASQRDWKVGITIHGNEFRY